MITVFCYVVLSAFVHRRSRRCCRLRQSPMVFGCMARISLFPIEQFDFGAVTMQKLSKCYKNCAAPYSETDTLCACMHGRTEGRLNRNIGLGWGLQFHSVFISVCHSLCVCVYVWYLIATMQFQLHIQCSTVHYAHLPNDVNDAISISKDMQQFSPSVITVTNATAAAAVVHFRLSFGKWWNFFHLESALKLQQARHTLKNIYIHSMHCMHSSFQWQFDYTVCYVDEYFDYSISLAVMMYHIKRKNVGEKWWRQKL